MSKLIHQGHLEKAVFNIFAGENIVKNARKEASFKNEDTGWYFEIDTWLPNLNLGFEFQDSYHFVTTWYHQNALQIVQTRDNIKNEGLSKLGVTLLSIPCWWKSDEQSLKATIEFARPDLISDDVAHLPIPLNPPPDFFKQYTVPDVGEVMLASFPPSLSSFLNSISPLNSWWMGEKYDGIRCIWNPERKVLYSRVGLELSLPTSLLSHLSSLSFLDSEIWFGRNAYIDSLRVVWGNWDSSAHFRMVAFDYPAKEKQELPFEERYEQLLMEVPLHHPFLAVAARLQCTKKETLKKAMKYLMTDDVGEGVILQLPKSAYVHGRTDAVIKLKAARGDAEGLVVDSSPDALSIKLPNGTILEVKRDQVKFGLDPKKGDVVTYEFERISRREIPVNLKIDRIRHDTSWEAVLHDFLLEQEKKEQRASTPEKNYSEKPARYWTTQQGQNSRKFLENFAKNQGFNPLVPENWYSIRKKDFPYHKGLIDTIKGGYVKALLYLFPDIGLKENKFVSVQKLIWKDVRNRRKFFDTIAKANQFDPLISSNWYSFSLSKVYNYKNGQDVMKYYQGDLGKALIHVYPDVNLQLSNFDSSAKEGIKAKQRQFFVSIASDLQFDPLIPNNWYSISKSTILNYKGALTVLSYHGHSFRKALVDLFPDVKFDSTKFLLWNDVNDRRRFFDRIAKEFNFDPLVPEQWGKIKRDTILSYKGGETVLSYHNNSYKTALRELYPEVNFSEDSFLKRFQTTNARQEFFLEFSRARGFDPFCADSWVQITKNDITSVKGGEEILSFYDNNHRRAILQLFPNIGLENSRNFMWGNSKDRREFFDKFAKETKGFDPLIAENWYGVKYNEISSLQGGQQVLSFHNNNLPKAIADLYPNIGMQKAKFEPNWESSNLRRRFFDEISRDRNFDPLVPSNWFNISAPEILKYRDAQKVLSYHGNNHKRALEELYPFMEGYKEKEKLSHRFFFDEFSSSRNFDPLVSVNWYSIVRDEIFTMQGGKEILNQYANSLKNAIPEIYPNINFDKTKFNQWENKEIRKLFLDKIAREIKIDPLVLENWRNVSDDKLKSFTGAQRVLAYHGKNILKAVKDLYPEIKI